MRRKSRGSHGFLRTSPTPRCPSKCPAGSGSKPPSLRSILRACAAPRSPAESANRSTALVRGNQQRAVSPQLDGAGSSSFGLKIQTLRGSCDQPGGAAISSPDTLKSAGKSQQAGDRGPRRAARPHTSQGSRQPVPDEALSPLGNALRCTFSSPRADNKSRRTTRRDAHAITQPARTPV